ncbi:MAG TPA: ABC transporter permease [Candidatus Saccharimonadales bacterium]|nr:ABC transporter permease [Candidatus Saccharimonadales bacterium]
MRLFRRVFSKHNRALLSELVRTDFKLRYQGSVLGYAWSLLRPLFMFAILYVVFVKVFPLGKGIPHYPVYLFTGIVLWNFFLEMTAQSLGSIVGRGDLIRKIRIPRWIIVFSSSISALINLGLNLVVLAIFMALNHVDPMRTLIFVPLLLVELYLLSLGVSLFLSALFVRFRDVSYIWDVVLQAGFYITPVLYPLSRVHNLLAEKIILLNPVAQVVQDVRYAIVSHADSVTTIGRIFQGGWYRLVPFGIVLIVLAGGLAYFKSQANSFAENI